MPPRKRSKSKTARRQSRARRAQVTRRRKLHKERCAIHSGSRQRLSMESLRELRASSRRNVNYSVRRANSLCKVKYGPNRKFDIGLSDLSNLLKKMTLKKKHRGKKSRSKGKSRRPSRR